MSEIVLDGLIGSNPLAAMAAFGLLRCCETMDKVSSPRLSWQFDGDWIAVLHTENELSRDELVAELVQRQRGRSDLEVFQWNDDVKVQPDEFASCLRDARASASVHNRETADFFTAFGSEFVTDKTAKRNVKPTAFHMTAGQQRFLRSIRQLAESIDPTKRRTRKQTTEMRVDQCKAAFAEALFGPWRYQDSEHALGWDPTTEALYALSAIAPTAAGPSSVRAAVWLAVESLPLFACLPTKNKLLTTGFDDAGKEFRWPIWTTPISLDNLKTLLEMPLGNADELRQRSVSAVFAATRITDPNGRGTLKPAVQVI